MACDDMFVHELTKEVRKMYEYESLIYEAGKPGGAYVIFPYDVRKEFGKGRVKVHVTFDGEPYDGSIVNMGPKGKYRGEHGSCRVCQVYR